MTLPKEGGCGFVIMTTLTCWFFVHCTKEVNLPHCGWGFVIMSYFDLSASGVTSKAIVLKMWIISLMMIDLKIKKKTFFGDLILTLDINVTEGSQSS